MAEMAENRTGMTGEETLLSLLYPRGREDMTAEQTTEFLRAAAMQEDYMKREGEAGVLSKRVGDVSVTYEKNGGIRCGGVKISPAAVDVLLRAGLLVRWV
jgi:hypothetical protein